MSSDPWPISMLMPSSLLCAQAEPVSLTSKLAADLKDLKLVSSSNTSPNATASGGLAVELFHLTGFNGKPQNSVHILPSNSIVASANATVGNQSFFVSNSCNSILSTVISSLVDGKQSFLNGHSARISTLAVSKAGNLAASGQI